MTVAVTEEQVLEALHDVKDPEIPMISVVELGIIQDVQVKGEDVLVSMTPTFTGCPAIRMMQEMIHDRVREMGVENVVVELSLEPAWTSDRMTDEAREKMEEIGLAPPAQHNGDIDFELKETVRCPYCETENTDVENPFGPTLCRAIYYCHDCQQPFEKFKAL